MLIERRALVSYQDYYMLLLCSLSQAFVIGLVFAETFMTVYSVVIKAILVCFFNGASSHSRTLLFFLSRLGLRGAHS